MMILRCALAMLFLASVVPVFANTYSEGWGPATGEPFPEFEVKSHTRDEVTLREVAGPRGTLLFLNRSVVW